MKKKIVALINSFLLLFTVNGCAQNQENAVQIEQFVEKLNSDSSLVILDVRTPPELSGPLGKIEGVINIPVQELNRRVSELNKYKDKEIAVICRTGNRSTYGTKVLLENGFDAFNVLGGMTAYRKFERKTN